MFGKKSVETLIVGAGPCGMTAALVLAQHGIDTAIVDAEPHACSHSNAVMLNPQTLELMDGLGFAERVVEGGYRVDNLLVYGKDGPRETIRLGDLPGRFPFAVSLPQSELEYLLEDELNKAGVHVLWNHRLSNLRPNDHGYQADLDRYSDQGVGYAVPHTERVVDKTQHYQANKLIATDGYNSVLRRITGAETSKLGEDQYFVFFEFETDVDAEHAVRLSIHEGLATAQYPLNGGFARLSLQFPRLDAPADHRNKDRDLVQDRDEQPAFLDDDHFRELIDTRVPWETGFVSRIRYRAAVPFEKRYLASPHADGVFFIGDAARSFGPLASLSLNLGLLEVDAFCSRYLSGRKKPSLSADLDELGHSMVAHWRAMADMEGLSSPIEKTDPWVAENRARILRSLPGTGETLERLAAQIHLQVSGENRVEV